MRNNSGRSKRAKKTALAGPQPKYPVDFAKPCVNHLKGTADRQAYAREANVTMEEVLETLQSTDGNKDYCYKIDRVFDPENPLDVVSGIRFLKGKLEVFHQDATVSREWSLDEQIAYVKCLIVSQEDDLKRAELEDDCARIQCVIRQLSAIIAKVENGEFDNVKVAGSTIKNFMSPPAEEGRAWAEALKNRITEHKVEVENIMEQVDALEEKDDKYFDDEVCEMMDEAGAYASIMEADKSINVDGNNAGPKNDNTGKNASKQLDSIGATQGITSGKEDAIVCYAEYVTVERRFGGRGSKVSKKTKIGARAAPYKAPEKIMVISVRKGPVYEEAIFDDELDSTCGDMDCEETSTKKDTDGNESLSEEDMDGKKTGGILPGFCTVSREVRITEQDKTIAKKKDEETEMCPVMIVPGAGNRRQQNGRMFDPLSSYNLLILIVVVVILDVLYLFFKALVDILLAGFDFDADL